MPKSKSTRGKKHRPIRLRVIMMSLERYSNIADWINRITLLAEVTLPAGKCTLADMLRFENLFNWTTGIIYQRFKNLGQAELEDVVPVIGKGRPALNAIFNREMSGKTTGYVATGDELKAIHESS